MARLHRAGPDVLRGKGLHDAATERFGKVDHMKGNAETQAEGFHGRYGVVSFSGGQKARVQSRDDMPFLFKTEKGEEAVGSAAYGNCDVHGGECAIAR